MVIETMPLPRDLEIAKPLFSDVPFHTSIPDSVEMRIETTRSLIGAWLEYETRIVSGAPLSKTSDGRFSLLSNSMVAMETRPDPQRLPIEVSETS